MPQTLDIRAVPVAQATPAPAAPRPSANSRRYERSQLVWLDQITRADERIVGTKVANLGELASLALPIPPGFVLPAGVYQQFLKSNRIDRLITRLLGSVDASDSRALHAASTDIQATIQRAPLTSS